MATIPTIFPQPNLNITQRVQAIIQFAQVWYQYFASLDNAVRLLTGGIGPNQTQNVAAAPVIGPLVNAANDAAAATAGVPLQGLYRTGNAVQIRLV